METSPEDRQEFWEKLYASPGFGIWQGNFDDMLVDREANDLASEFIASKIRQRVKDPVTAEKLIPKTMGLERGVFLWKPTIMKFITKITLNLLILTIRRLSALQKWDFDE